MKKSLLIALIFLFHCTGNTEPRPRYGCQFWQPIISGINKHQKEYRAKYDSIINRSSNRILFEDSLFQFKHVNYVVDTYAFFGADCNTIINGKKFVFLNEFPDTAGSKMNMIYLRSICFKHDRLYLSFRHPKSEYNVLFEFEYSRCWPSREPYIFRELDILE